MTLVLAFVVLATLTGLPAILAGSIAAVFALVAIARVLAVLPSTFDPK